MHDSSDDLVASVFDSGSLGVFNKQNNKLITFKDKLHKEAIWFCQFHNSDPNLLFTAGDDASFKLVDTRIECAVV